MAITLKQLEIFHGVVVAGSISKATKLLGVSQPTVSQQLSKLEDCLGSQLIKRSPSRSDELTPSGEHWFRVASEISQILSCAWERHHTEFDGKQLVLQLGSIPSMRRRFIALAAQAARDVEGFKHFAFKTGENSEQVIDMISMHRVNCAIVNTKSAEALSSSLQQEFLFSDQILWAVPRDVPIDYIEQILKTKRLGANAPPSLSCFVAITDPVSWQNKSEGWYATTLPFAEPFYSCPVHRAGMEIVAQGLATAHLPSSLLPHLSSSLQDKIRFIDTGEHARDISLVMPKHLMTLKPFAQFFTLLAKRVKEAHASAMDQFLTRSVGQMRGTDRSPTHPVSYNSDLIK
ncbi:LysR family transcriptional regulator [Celeribacter sp.]|uniref:LysR family transcriptional regulator n=1 Tax=Celeribacter sp. TaxID=1890673 RepID=UPI003A8EC3FE